jgi:hypothetical protein
LVGFAFAPALVGAAALARPGDADLGAGAARFDVFARDDLTVTDCLFRFAAMGCS